MVSSIVLADFDGTFATPSEAPFPDWVRPTILNVQASVLFGRVSRYLHWMIATLILILVPMGMFLSVSA